MIARAGADRRQFNFPVSSEPGDPFSLLGGRCRCRVGCRLTGISRSNRDLPTTFLGSKISSGERPLRRYVLRLPIFLGSSGPAAITIRATCLQHLTGFARVILRPVLFAGTSMDDDADLAPLAAIFPASRPCNRQLSTDAVAACFSRCRSGLDRAAAAKFRRNENRCCLRISALLWLAAAISGGGLVSRLSASTFGAAFFAGRAMATRSRFSHADRIRPHYHAEQRERASRLQEILSGREVIELSRRSVRHACRRQRSSEPQIRPK